MRPGILGNVLLTLGQVGAGTAATPPSTPEVSVADDGTGTSATVTVDGDAGATHLVYYRLSTAWAWTSGGSRSGDGTVQITGLTLHRRYVIVAVSRSAAGLYSLPSSPAAVRTTDGTASDVLVVIADAVVSELNAGSFSQAFTAVREYLPELELKDLDTLHVKVVGRGIETRPITRRREHQVFVVDVGVLKRYAAETNIAIDPLMALCQEIRDALRLQRLADYPTAVCIEAPRDVVYSPAHIREHRQFTSILTFRFTVIR